jgi:glycosyltransferase involved in cell wall biosynthesis
MTSHPLTSIIIPTFNRAHLICDTLNSIKEQTNTNWECIVIDDGSTDNTEELLHSYIKKDNRFQYHKRPETHLQGGNGARNYGFNLSKGDYIQWFDSDDVMMPDFVEAKLQPFIAQPDTDVVFSAFENVNSEGERTRIANQHFSGNIIDDLVDGHVSFGPLSFMLRRDKIEKLKYDETLTKNQDLDFFFRFFTTSEALKIVHVKKILYTVRSHKGSMTFGTSKDINKMASTYKVYLMVLNHFSNIGNKKGVKRYRFHCLNNLKVMLKNGFYSDVVRRLIAFKYINIRQKIYLIGCVLSEMFFGRGSNQFIKLKDNHDNS